MKGKDFDMGVTSYYSFGGEILGEETGGVRRDYLTDALGSVTATVTGSGVVENTYRYKPYGETLVKTGTGSDPKFQWNGKWGYQYSISKVCNYYIRSRNYSSGLALFLKKATTDAQIKGENCYGYGFANPVNYLDYNGDFPTIDKTCSGIIPPSDLGKMKGAMTNLCKVMGDKNSPKRKIIEKCLRDRGLFNPETFTCFENWCKRGKNVSCGVADCPLTYSIKCKPIPCAADRKVPGPACARTNCNSNNDPDGKVVICSFWWTDFPKLCPGDSVHGHCGNHTPGVPGTPPVTIIHEIMHLCTVCNASPGHKVPFNKAAECIVNAIGVK